MYLSYIAKQDAIIRIIAQFLGPPPKSSSEARPDDRSDGEEDFKPLSLGEGFGVRTPYTHFPCNNPLTINVYLVWVNVDSELNSVQPPIS